MDSQNTRLERRRLQAQTTEHTEWFKPFLVFDVNNNASHVIKNIGILYVDLLKMFI